MSNNDILKIHLPDDWHVHLRDDDAMKTVLFYTARQYGRALIMPNLKPPVTNAKMAKEYRARIEALLKNGGADMRSFIPSMTIYLTDQTTPRDVQLARIEGVRAVKLYPANATTNSAEGVTDIKKLSSTLKEMELNDIVLCIHGETLVSETRGDKTRGGRVGQLRREAVFLDETLSWIIRIFPRLRVVLEHITTREAVAFVTSASGNVAATITAHHLLATLDDALETHHNKCMPILKEEPHRQALLDAATSGNPKFFGGTDSAPHSKAAKETACGCAGCFTALHAIELYATAFEERNALNRLDDFLSSFGARFYKLPRNRGFVTLRRTEWTIPMELPFGEGQSLVPFWAGKKLNWKADQKVV